MDNEYRWPFMAQLTERMSEAFSDRFNGEYTTGGILADVHLDDESFLEVEIFANNTVDVYIYHRDEANKRACPNVEKYIQDNMPSWRDYVDEYNDSCQPYDEWQEHGFRDEADYWRWKEG